MTTDERLPWFKCEQSKLLGALSAMEAHEGYLYVIVTLRIYEVGGPCPDSHEALVRRTGLTKAKVVDAITRLTEGGKLRVVDGGLFNDYAAGVLEEMEKARIEFKKSGKKGADKRWGNNQQNQQNGDGDPKLPLMGSDSDLDSERDRDSERKKDSVVVTDDWPEDYGDRFWKLYPPGRKGEKQAVMAKLAKIRKSKLVTFAALMAGLQRYVDTNPDPQFTPAPMVWLNKGRWDVEIVRGPPRGPDGKPRGPTMADIAMGRDR